MPRRVELKPYIPDNYTSGIAVVVCPGGSYFWLDMATEGHGVARWLCAKGIAAFVLNYRTGGYGGFMTNCRALFGGAKHPDMIRDLQRSIQFLRENCDKYNIAHDRIGAMGFSAGGHLVMTAAQYFDTNFMAELGISPKVSLRPDFVASIYPVVTLIQECVHRRSRRGLLGDYGRFDKRMRKYLSLEKNINPASPPVFLMNCIDDPIVKYRNSNLLDEALTDAGIDHRFIQYKTGGHGFGADESKASAEAIAWKDEFMEWINSLFK